MKRHFIISILIGSFHFVPLMAHTTIDSLKAVLQNSNNIEHKIGTYLDLSRLYQQINLDSARIMVNYGLALANEIKSENEIAEAHARLGDIAVMNDSLDLALSEYGKAIDYCRLIDNPDRLNPLLLVIGNVYLVKANYYLAMQNYMEGIKISEKQHNANILPHYFNNIGYVYYELNEYNKSLDFYTQSLDLFKKQKDSLNIAKSLGNIGSIYVAFNNYDIAKDYFYKAISIYGKYGSKVTLVQLLMQLSELQISNNQPDSALFYLNSSRQLLEKSELEYKGPKSAILGEIFTLSGLAYFMKEDWDMARINLRKGYQLGTQTQQRTIVRESAEYLSKLFEEKGLTDSAFYYHKLFKSYSDSISNEDNMKELTKLELQYKFDQQIKERELLIEIEKARQKRQTLIYIIIFCGLLLLLVVFVLLLKLEKNKKMKIDLERKQLITDLEYKNKELTTHVLYLLKKNEFILSISEKLKGIIPEIKFQNKRHIAEVIQELEKGSSMEIWKEFEIRFQDVHNNFFDNLNSISPDLTPNELRLCAFLKLNMTTKDIAAVTYQSVKSIDMARFRLRKKLGIDKDENLVSFLTKL